MQAPGSTVRYFLTAACTSKAFFTLFAKSAALPLPQ